MLWHVAIAGCGLIAIMALLVWTANRAPVIEDPDDGDLRAARAPVTLGLPVEQLSVKTLAMILAAMRSAAEQHPKGSAERSEWEVAEEEFRQGLRHAQLSPAPTARRRVQAK